MQTNSLPLPLPVTGAQPPSPRMNVSMPNDGVNFGATLTRQIEQRQLEARQALVQPQQPAMPSSPSAPKPQPAPKPAASDAKAPARETVREPAKEGGRAAEAADKTASAAAQGATGKDAAEGENKEDQAGGAKAADAVVDMLALMASLSGVQTAAPAALEKVATDSGALFAGSKGKAGDGAEPLVKLDTQDALLPAADGAQKAEPGIDLRALDLSKQGEMAKLPAEAGDFAAKLRDSAAQAAAKEPLPAAEALTNLALQTSALQNAEAAGSVPTDRLSARVGTPAWDNQVGQKVIWMVGGEEQSATLELNPPDLGPVQVVLNVSNDMASVTFSSQQLEVRQALENALPRLREMMGESGIALGNASVNAGNEGRHGQDGQGAKRSGSGGGGGGDSAVAEAAPRPRTSILGGAGAVDTFA